MAYFTNADIVQCAAWIQEKLRRNAPSKAALNRADRLITLLTRAVSDASYELNAVHKLNRKLTNEIAELKKAKKVK